MPGLDPLARGTLDAVEIQRWNAVQRKGEPYVAWRDGERGLQLVSLERTQARYSVGRSSSADVSIQTDGTVSTLHALLELIDTTWVLTDSISTNGTKVNGAEITPSRRLADDDRCTIGSTIVTFRDGKLPSQRAATVELGSTDPIATHLAGVAVRRTDLSAIELEILRLLCAPMLLHGADEPESNAAIAHAVYPRIRNVARVMTRLFKQFDIDAAPKRRRLALAAITAGIVSKNDYPNPRS